MAGAPLLPVPLARTAQASSEDEETDEETAPGHAMPPYAAAAARAAAPARPEPAQTAADAAADAARRDAIARAAAEVREALRDDGTLSELARQVLVEEVPEGLRVQLVDADGQPVFATGQAAPNDRGRALLLRVATVLARLPNPIEITGHTDAAPFRGGAGRTNWDLSAERANATRRLLLEGGIEEARIRSVSGRADRDPLLPGQPLGAANRRVAVLMLMPPAERPAP
jgi:chemotaxis protein MotB